MSALFTLYLPEIPGSEADVDDFLETQVSFKFYKCYVSYGRDRTWPDGASNAIVKVEIVTQYEDRMDVKGIAEAYKAYFDTPPILITITNVIAELVDD